MPIDRGPALTRLAFAAGASAMVAGSARPGGRGERPLGLASITVADALSRDYAGTLRLARAMGYTHFGFPLTPCRRAIRAY